MKHLPSSLNLLRTFEAAGRHQSFTLAAQELCITTSAVSQQIRKLEEELSTTLFHRQSRGLALTDTGLAYWQDIQLQLQALERRTRALVQPTSIALRISLMPPLASRVVLPHLDLFQDAHPTIELHLDASMRYTDLGRDAVDLAIRFGTPPWPGCHHEKLLDLYVQPVCPPTMAAGLAPGDDLPTPSTLPLIHMTNRPDSWQQYHALSGTPFAPAARQFHVDDYPAAIEAAETLGVALALAPLEQSLINSGRLAAPWPAVGPLPEAVFAVWRQDSERGSQIQAFLDWLKARLAQLPTID